MKETSQKRQYYIPERLKKQLAQIKQHSLTVVEAPSGFGKTTAVSDYIKENLTHDAQAYWYTCLGEPMVSMWNGICNLLEYVDSDVANQLNEVDILSTGVVPEIVRHLQKLSCDCETYLVIDNYQILDRIAPKELLSAFSLMKGSPKLHMVVITQQLSLQQLTALRHSSAQIIGASDFLFDINSTARLFKLAGIRLSDENLKRVQSDTEGWVSALCLQIIFYQQNGYFTYNAGIEHLVEVAICEKLTREEKDLLVALSVLDCFSIPQARSMLGEKGLPESFETLFATSAFIRYYPENDTYIMHSILQEYLKKRFYQHLPKERQMRMLSRAGASCVELSDYSSATRFFLESEDFDAVFSFMLRADYLQRPTDWVMAERIIKTASVCPPDVMRRHPESLLVLAFQLFLFSQYELSGRLFALAGEVLQNPVDLDAAQVMRLRGEMEYLLSFSEYNDVEKMSARHKAALKLLDGPSRHRFKLDNFGSVSIVSMYWNRSGELERTLALMDENLPRFRILSGEHSAGSDSAMRAEWLLLQGNLEDAEALCHKTIYIAQSKRQSCICLCAELVLARIALLRGAADDYQTAVENIRRYADTKLGLHIERAAQLCLAFLSLTLGETDGLADWLYDLALMEKSLLHATVPYGHMLHGRMLLLRRRHGELYGFSPPMLERTREMNYILQRVYELLSLASAKFSDYRLEEARTFLYEALELALPDKVYLPFAEYASLRPFLEESMDSGFDREQIGYILSLCERHQMGVKAVSKALRMTQSPLTPRERDIALLARDRLSTKEIADRLFVSESTVKSTLKSIYQKLEVASKGQLVDKIF